MVLSAQDFLKCTATPVSDRDTKASFPLVKNQIISGFVWNGYNWHSACSRKVFVPLYLYVFIIYKKAAWVHCDSTILLSGLNHMHTGILFYILCYILSCFTVSWANTQITWVWLALALALVHHHSCECIVTFDIGRHSGPCLHMSEQVCEGWVGREASERRAGKCWSSQSKRVPSRARTRV